MCRAYFSGMCTCQDCQVIICKCFLTSKTDSQLLEEQEKLTNDKQFFDEQRATLESERKQLTDAAIKLGHEVGVDNKYQISIYL